MPTEPNAPRTGLALVRGTQAMTPMTPGQRAARFKQADADILERLS